MNSFGERGAGQGLCGGSGSQSTHLGDCGPAVLIGVRAGDSAGVRVPVHTPGRLRTRGADGRGRSSPGRRVLMVTQPRWELSSSPEEGDDGLDGLCIQTHGQRLTRRGPATPPDATPGSRKGEVAPHRGQCSGLETTGQRKNRCPRALEGRRSLLLEGSGIVRG